jgi:hypothetical protein
MLETRRAFLLRAGWLGAPWLLSHALGAEASAHSNVRSHGARGDGRAKDTLAIQAAIDAAARTGGTVDFPPGEYVSGTLRLRGGITLRLDAGATLLASRDDGDFDPPEALGYETFADRETSDFAFALLQGRRVAHLSIVGPGRIAGNRRSRGGPKLIALKECRGIQIRGLTIADAGNYNISLLGCEEVDIEGVTIRNGYSDGIDPDCCRNVRIANCHIESRDDAVALKTSRALGAPRATEDVTVTGCHLVTRHNALKLGTESTGDFRQIVFRDCTIVGRRPSWKGEMTSGVSLQAVDGGTLEGVTVSNIRMANIRSPIFVRLARRGRGQEVPSPGALRDVSISNVVATGASGASSITGIPGHPVTRISLRNIRVAARGGGAADLVSLDVPEMERMYPDAYLFGDLPAYGLYGRHVVGLTVDEVDLSVGRPDARPAIVLDNVREVDVRVVQATPAADGGATLWLHSVRDGVLRDLRPHGAGKAVVRVSGKSSARLRLLGADVRQADGHTVLLDADVAATVLQAGTEVTPR